VTAQLAVSDLIGHLARQVESARRLLGLLLSQTEAIKRQDVETLLARLGDVQGEMRTRDRLEVERDALIRNAAARLGVAFEQVDLDAILTLVPAPEAESARALSAELRGLLVEAGHVHTRNRILIRQELAFVDHLMRVLTGAPEAGYSPGGWTRSPQGSNVVDARV
jgi:hypothetical protein